MEKDKVAHFTFFHVFYEICILKSFNTIFQLLSAASLNLGQPQNGVLGKGINHKYGLVKIEMWTIEFRCIHANNGFFPSRKRKQCEKAENTVFSFSCNVLKYDSSSSIDKTRG